MTGVSKPSALLVRCGLAALACGLSACALIHDSSKPAALIAPEQVDLARDIHLARDGWPQARWWTRYGDSQLNGLIDFALEHAPSILIERNRVAQASAQLDVVKSGTRLQALVLGIVNEDHVSANGFLGPFALNDPAIGTTGPWYTEGIVGVGAKYTFDLWGAERSAVAASVGMRNAQLAERAAVELEIATDVAQLHFQMQTTLQKLDLLEQARDIAKTAVAAHEARAERGLESQTPAAESRALLLQIEQQISMAQSVIQQLREILRALVGAHAGDFRPINTAPPPTVNVGLPSRLSYDLLARRPDLQVMRWYVQASFNRIDAAKAAFYPNFDIKAFIGFDALHLSDLTLHSSRQLNFIPGLSLPIFDGGRLNANLQHVRTTSNTLIEQYNQAVLDAVRTVAVAATRLEALSQQEPMQSARLREVKFAYASSAAHASRGLISSEGAREARLPVLAQEAELIDIHGRQIDQEISLIRALGGGFNAEAVNESK
jgi:multidrug efflux system outer membrane protein